MREDHLVWQENPSWRGFVPRAWKWLLAYVALWLFLLLFHVVGAVSLISLILITLAFIALVIGYGYLRIKTTVHTITTTRVGQKYGIINVQTEQTHISNITNITVERNLTERLLGIGRVDIDTANDSRNILDWWGIPKPSHVEDLINNLRMEIDDSRFGANLREEEEG